MMSVRSFVALRALHRGRGLEAFSLLCDLRMTAGAISMEGLLIVQRNHRRAGFVFDVGNILH